MKLLFVSQYVYRPDQPGANRIYDFLQLLAKRGHDPRVVAGGVHYLIDEVDPDLARRKLIETRWGDVPVILAYATPDFRKGVMARFRSYFSYTFYAFRACLRVKKPDVVLVSIQPMFIAPLAWLLARLRGVPFVLEVRDLWPDVAVELGLIRSRWLIALGRWLEKFIYRRASRIVTIGSEMKRVIAAKGIDAGKIEVLPQGYQPPYDEPRPRDVVRRELGVDDEFVLMFTGSFGLANNDVSLIADAAVRLKDEPGLVLVMVGGGDRKRDCVARCEQAGVKNVRFLPIVPKTEIPSLLGAADAAVMALPPGELWKICLQNKIFDYLGIGLPVVAAVAGDQAELLRESGGGIAVSPGDLDGFCAAILRLRDDVEERTRMGREAKTYIRRNLMREEINQRYVDLLERWVGSSSQKV